MDNELVRRKKVGGRAGKKKWKRSSDTTGLQLHDLKQAKKDVREASRPKSTGPLFKIMVEPDVAVKQKLAKDRFKAVPVPVTSKAELKILKQMEKTMEKSKAEVETKQSQSAPKQAKPTQKRDADLEAEFDVWGADLKDLNIYHDKPQIKTKHEIELPKTLKPYAGQSYNPSHQDQLALMKVVVDKAEEKKPTFKSKSDKAQARAVQESLVKRPPQKPRTKKEKELFDAHEKQRELKKKEYDSKNIERYFNEAKNKWRKHGRVLLP